MVGQHSISLLEGGIIKVRVRLFHAMPSLTNKTSLIQGHSSWARGDPTWIRCWIAFPGSPSRQYVSEAASVQSIEVGQFQQFRWLGQQWKEGEIVPFTLVDRPFYIIAVASISVRSVASVSTQTIRLDAQIDLSPLKAGYERQRTRLPGTNIEGLLCWLCKAGSFIINGTGRGNGWGHFRENVDFHSW